jgi:hypothetical protein
VQECMGSVIEPLTVGISDLDRDDDYRFTKGGRYGGLVSVDLGNRSKVSVPICRARPLGATRGRRKFRAEGQRGSSSPGSTPTPVPPCHAKNHVSQSQPHDLPLFELPSQPDKLTINTTLTNVPLVVRRPFSIN